MLSVAACAFWLASNEAKILVGTLRCGSGITGSGGVTAVVPVVNGERFCVSDALICVLSRPFGAGFGTGTVWASDRLAAPATGAATVRANRARVPADASDSTGRNFQFLVNAKS